MPHPTSGGYRDDDIGSVKPNVRRPAGSSTEERRVGKRRREGWGRRILVLVEV